MGWDSWIGGVAPVALPSVLVAAVVMALIRGRLFTRSHMDDVRSSYEEMLRDKDRQLVAKDKQAADLWEALRLNEEARRTSDRQVERLLEHTATVEQLLAGLAEKAGLR